MTYRNKNFSSNNKKPVLLVVAGLAVLLLAGGIGWMVYQKNNAAPAPKPINTVDYEPPSKEAKQAGEETKLDSVEHKGQESDKPAGDPRVVISKLHQEGGSKQVVVQTELYGGHWKNCTVTFSKDGAVVTKSAGTMFQSAYSSCLGFGIPASEFAAAGTWEATLTAETAEGTIIKSNTKNIDIAL